MEPRVSVPMAKETQPAAVAEAGPALEPDEPAAGFQGLLVRPRYHWSPRAKRPVASLATRMAPALVRRATTSAVSLMMRSLNSAAPQVVGAPGTANRSLTPQG